MVFIIFFFFFSSRRRHTRCGRDWSSDVCSSDLLTKNVFDTGMAQTIGKNNEHLRMFVKQNHSQGFPAIAFKKGKLLKATCNLKLMNLVYSLSENQWKDKITLQIQVKDLEIH